MSIYLAHNHKMLKSAGRYVGWVRNNLPPLGANSIRVKWKKGESPKNRDSLDYLNSINVYADSITLVDQVDNIYDITRADPDWTSMFAAGGSLDEDRLIEILEGNLQNVTDIKFLCSSQVSLKSVSNLNTSNNLSSCYTMFAGCSSLTRVEPFNTSQIDDFVNMFQDCVNLEILPQLQTGSARDVRNMFKNCYRASTGILSMYNQMSTQSTPPSQYEAAFRDCGRDSVTGSAELAQIPSSWK